MGFKHYLIFLKKILISTEVKSDTDLSKYLQSVAVVDFADNFYQASGVGRSRIRKTLLLANQFINLEDVAEKDIEDLKRILQLV